MKKLAIISSFKYHTDCIGFLLEIFNDWNITTYLPRFIPFNNVGYFKTLYRFQTKTLNAFQKDRDNFDLVVSLTSNDEIAPWFEPDEKTVGLLHIESMESGIKNFITISPYVTTPENSVYILPIFKGRTYSGPRTDTIVYVGYLEQRYIDEDTLNFMKNTNYNFVFISGAKIEIPLPNVKVYQSLSTKKMVDILSRAKFILARKIPFQRTDRFSGSLVLGLSHRTPFIIQEKFSNDYGIPGVTFKQSYSELIDAVNSMSKDDYDNLFSQTNAFCEQKIAENKNNIDSFVENLTL